MRRDDNGLVYGIYPERSDSREPFADRLIDNLGFLVHRCFARGLRDHSLLAAEVRRHADRFAAGLLAPRVPEMRYQLRRQGMRGALLAEALGLHAAAIREQTGAMPAAEALGAAHAMLTGRIVDLGDRAQRRQAVSLTAAVFALSGVPVHVIVASDVLAQRSAQAMEASMAALGFVVAWVEPGMDAPARRRGYQADVCCVGYRELAFDYLRDRMSLGGRRRGMLSGLQRISGDASANANLMLRGLHCAIVEDADAVLIDDARNPLVISAESDLSQERLLYEQAIELARALREDADFLVDENGVGLTPGGSGRLARLVQPLGGMWSGQHRREELIVEALVALHLVERDRDYRIQGGRVMFPKPEPEESGEIAPVGELLTRLVEVKEGVKLAGKRDVLARISGPRFFLRYLQLCGVCHDARGLEGEFWSMYRLKVERAAAAAPLPALNGRLFFNESHKQRALVEAIAAGSGSGQPVVVALRTQPVAKAVMDALAAAGLKPVLVRGLNDDQERAALANALDPGAITVALFPAERAVALHGPIGTRLIVAELHDSLRQLGQLYRAYAAGEAEHWLSLEEQAVVSRIDLPGQVVVSWFSEKSGELPPHWAKWLIRRVQKGIEKTNAALRHEVVSLDRQLGDSLAFSGSRD
jgi:preprotein translocase subunit SecA